MATMNRRNPHQRQERLSSFRDLDNHVKVERKPQPQPEPIKFEGEANRYYETKRNGRITRIWLVSVKKDKVVIKDDPQDAHSREMSLAKFVKFYA